jgi:ABC-2 type transport system ATP-binding protein
VQPVADGQELGIAVRDVWRYFGAVPALSGMTLSAPYGQVTALVGPNGAGKTTLLLILASLLRPDRGEVRVAGADPTTDPYAVRANMGWMPDNFGVYDQLTAREYLDFFASAYRLNRSTVGQHLDDLLAMIHLSEYARLPVHVLSRGQKQRLALARALIHSPRVLLLDEPASGLDPRSRVELRDILRDLAGAGAAVLVSSHILAELEEIADRVVLVSGGQTVGEHTMADLNGRGRLNYRIRATDADALASALSAALAQPDTEPNANAHGITISSHAAGTEIGPMSEDEAADLLIAVIKAGVRVLAFEPVGSNLETAYLAMTEERR